MWKENCKIAYKFKSTNEWLVVPKDGYTVDGKTVAVVSDGFELKCDHNPYHDKLGRFTTKGNGSDWSNQCAEEKARVLGLPPNKQAYYVAQHDGATKEACIEAMRSGKTKKLVDEYFAKLEANGDPNPIKPVSEQFIVREEVASGKYKSYIEARTAHIKRLTGQDDTEASKSLVAFEKWVSNAWRDADQDVLDKYIEQDHAYNGKIYRGLHF